MIPNRYLVKKYLGRLLLAIVILPVNTVFLFWIEWQSIHPTLHIQGLDAVYIPWIGRVISTGIFLLCFRNLLSVIKLFMAAIPLSYHDIQRGIWVNAWIFTTVFTGIIVSTSHALMHPMVSLVIAFITATVILGGLVRIKRKKDTAGPLRASAKPHRTKDV